MEWVALVAIAGIISYTIIRIVELNVGARPKNVIDTLKSRDAEEKE